MVDYTQADTVHVQAMFIKAVKKYICHYMDTKKCTSLGRTYTEALTTENKSKTVYKNNNSVHIYKNLCKIHSKN